jgi:hypothetical protein
VDLDVRPLDGLLDAGELQRTGASIEKDDLANATVDERLDERGSEHHREGQVGEPTVVHLRGDERALAMLPSHQHAQPTFLGRVQPDPNRIGPADA